MSMLHRWLDPDGYAQKKRIEFAVVVSLVLIIAMWKTVTEVQYFFIGKTTKADILENQLVSYLDGEERRQRKLRIPPESRAAVGQVQIDYHPGTGLCRIAGTHEWWAPITLLLTGLVLACLLRGVLREALEYSRSSPNKQP